MIARQIGQYRAVTAAALLLAALVPDQARAGAAEEEVFAAFETFCLQQLAEPTKAAEMLAAIGVQQVPEASAKALLQQQAGRVWILRGDATRFAVMLSDKGACTAYGPDISDRMAALSTFRQNTRNREFHKEVVGSEMEHFYAVTVTSLKGDPDTHALVALRFSNLKSVLGFFFTSIPEQVAKADGMNLPQWP